MWDRTLTRTCFRLGTGTAVIISGAWRECPPGKEQSHELHAEEVSIVGVTDAEVSLTILIDSCNYPHSDHPIAD